MADRNPKNKPIDHAMEGLKTGIWFHHCERKIQMIYQNQQKSSLPTTYSKKEYWWYLSSQRHK